MNTTTPKHTPGPWTVGEHHGKPAVFDSYPAIVCRPGLCEKLIAKIAAINEASNLRD